MRIRRILPIVLAVLLIAAAVAVAVVLRKHAPPEPARLLPSADGFFYVNLQWMRRANVAGQLPEVPHDPEYDQFIQATGFQFERDLDEAAFAVHYPQKGGVQESRFSEVFVGKIDGERLRSYLGKLASSVEPYQSIDIYNIALDGRTLRVAILGVDAVAASNNADPSVIRGMIDRSRKLASPFGGPAVLRQYYKQVPLASLVWGIFRTGENSDFLANHGVSSPLDFSFLFNKPAVIVASLRYLGSVHLRAEAFTDSEDESRRVSDQLTNFLNIFHSAEVSVGNQGSDPDVKEFFDSLKVEQHEKQAVLTAKISPAFVRKAMAEAPIQATAPAENAPAQSAPTPPRKKAGRK